MLSTLTNDLPLGSTQDINFHLWETKYSWAKTSFLISFNFKCSYLFFLWSMTLFLVSCHLPCWSKHIVNLIPYIHRSKSELRRLQYSEFELDQVEIWCVCMKITCASKRNKEASILNTAMDTKLIWCLPYKTHSIQAELNSVFLWKSSLPCMLTRKPKLARLAKFREAKLG